MNSRNNTILILIYCVTIFGAVGMVHASPVKSIGRLFEVMFMKSAKNFHGKVQLGRAQVPISLKNAFILKSVSDMKLVTDVVNYETMHGVHSLRDAVALKVTYNLLSDSDRKIIDRIHSLPSAVPSVTQSNLDDVVSRGVSAISKSFKLFMKSDTDVKIAKRSYESALKLSKKINEDGSSYNRRIYLFLKRLYEKSDAYKKYAHEIVANPEFLFNIHFDNRYFRILRTGKVRVEDRVCARQDLRKIVKELTGHRVVADMKGDLNRSLHGWNTQEKVVKTLKNRLTSFAKKFTSKLGAEYKKVVHVVSKMRITEDRRLEFDIINVCGEIISLQLGNHRRDKREVFVKNESGTHFMGAQDLNDVLISGRDKTMKNTSVKTYFEWKPTVRIAPPHPMSYFAIDHIFMELCGGKFSQGRRKKFGECKIRL